LEITDLLSTDGTDLGFFGLPKDRQNKWFPAFLKLEV
jgi:hypothetical protein